MTESRKQVSDDELMKTFYRQDRPSIVIPEKTAHMLAEEIRLEEGVPSESKKMKLSEETTRADVDDQMDINKMLSSFVDKRNDLSKLKQSFKKHYS